MVGGDVKSLRALGVMAFQAQVHPPSLRGLPEGGLTQAMTSFTY